MVLLNHHRISSRILIINTVLNFVVHYGSIMEERECVSRYTEHTHAKSFVMRVDKDENRSIYLFTVFVKQRNSLIQVQVVSDWKLTKLMEIISTLILMNLLHAMKLDAYHGICNIKYHPTGFNLSTLTYSHHITFCFSFVGMGLFWNLSTGFVPLTLQLSTQIFTINIIIVVRQKIAYKIGIDCAGARICIWRQKGLNLMSSIWSYQ